jgi:hypothetical protein
MDPPSNRFTCEAALGATPRRSAGDHDTERPRGCNNSVSLAYHAVELRRPATLLGRSRQEPGPTVPVLTSIFASTARRSPPHRRRRPRTPPWPKLKNSSARSSRLTSGGNTPHRTLVTNLNDGIGASSGHGDGGGNRPRLLDHWTLPHTTTAASGGCLLPECGGARILQAREGVCVPRL